MDEEHIITDHPAWPLPEATPHPRWLFALLASTFVWGFVITNVAFKKFVGWNEWVTLFAYPVVCWLAAAFLLLSKRSGRLFFAVAHIAIGVAWVVFALWIAHEFARSFWR